MKGGEMKIRSLFLSIATGLVIALCGEMAAPTKSGQKETTMTSNTDFVALVTKGDAEKVKEILKAEPSLARATDKDGVSALLKAVYYNRKEVVEVLLAARTELDIFE